MRPRQFCVLMKAYADQQKREDIRAGVVASIVALVNGVEISPAQIFGHADPARSRELQEILEAEKLKRDAERYEYRRQKEQQCQKSASPD